jgi:ATP-dependent DNA ligase
MMDLPKRVHLVESKVVEDMDVVYEMLEDYLAKGEEGLILKSMNGPWENKRATHQIKFKGELDCDLLITGIEKGTGKYEGQLGAIICESADGKIKVNVGSGFNEEQRANLKEEDLIGKIVAVKYNARIQNKLGDESLFLPIFLEIREDKTDADSSEGIK